MNKFIFIIFSIILFSGFIFAAGDTTPGLNQDVLFDVTIKLPNPYYGVIVSDFANIANPGSVYETSIRGNSVTSAKIANNAVTNSKIADNSVSSSKIQNYSISSLKIAPDSIDPYHINNLAVETNKLDNWAVTSQKIADAAVTKEKIAVKSVDYARLEVYPLGNCPLNNSGLVYKEASGGLPNRLEWVNSAPCSGTSFSIGSISSNRSYEYFSGPFSQCVKSVVHTVSPVSCVGAECVEQWGIYRSGGSDTNTSVINNISNGTRTITFNASENNLYASSYDIRYTLSQPLTGKTETVVRNSNYNGFQAINDEQTHCSPVVPSSLNIIKQPADGCTNFFEVRGVFSCVGSCSYTMYLNNLPYAEGTFTGLNQTVTEIVNISDILGNNPKVKFKITNTGPSGLVGLETFSPEGTLQITLPQTVDGLPCNQ